jgi:hypothetical protein
VCETQLELLPKNLVQLLCESNDPTKGREGGFGLARPEGEPRVENSAAAGNGPGGPRGAYVYLASDRARGVTGVIVNSDGGIGIRG